MKIKFFAALLSLATLSFSPYAAEGWTIEDVLDGAQKSAQTQNTVREPSVNAFMLVSLSMPRASLERLALDAKDAGIPLVFRGVPKEHTTDTKLALLNPKALNEFAFLIESGAEVQINPELFSDHNIQKVPALLLKENTSGLLTEQVNEAQKLSGPEKSKACGPKDPANALVVLGDVTLGYALDKITDRTDSFGAAAQAFRARLGGRS